MKKFIFIGLFICGVMYSHSQAGRLVSWSFGMAREVTDLSIDTAADIIDGAIPI